MVMKMKKWKCVENNINEMKMTSAKKIINEENIENEMKMKWWK